MSTTEFFRQKIEPSILPKTILAKWSDKALDEGFVPFPKRLLRSMSKIFKDKPMDKLAVILAIVDFQRERLTRDPSLPYLAFTADMPLARFTKILKELEKENLIATTKTDTGIRVRLDGLMRKIEELTEE